MTRSTLDPIKLLNIQQLVERYAGQEHYPHSTADLKQLHLALGRRLNESAMKVLSVLHYYNEGAGVAMSIPSLKLYTGLSHKTIRAAIRSCIEIGLMRQAPYESGTSKPKTYILEMKAIAR